MHLKRGLVFLLLFGAGALTWSGCAGHGGGIVPAGSGSSSVPNSKAVRHPSTYQTVRRNVLARAHSDAAIPAAGTTYAGTVKTIGALLNNPTGLTYDADDGKIYVVDRNANNQTEILRVYPNGATSIFVTLAGNASSIVYDHATQSFYVTSGQGSVNGSSYPGIYQITSSGSVSILAGGKVWGIVDGTGPGAGFEEPTGIALDTSNGVLYFADGNVIRSVTTGGTVTTITGQILGYYSTYGYGVAYNAKDGNLYVGNGSSATILQVTTAGQSKTFAGTCLNNGTPYCAGLERDGKAASALFDNPYSVAADPSTGDIYVADSGNNAIRKISLSGQVSVLAGSGLQAETDGIGLSAAFNSPTFVAVGGRNAYVLDLSSNTSSVRTMRSVTLQGSAPPPPATNFHLFVTPTLYPDLQSIAGNANSTYLWYTEGNSNAGKIGRLSTSGASTEYSVGGAPQTVALGADNTPWFTTSSSPVEIGHLVNGQATEWAIPNALAPYYPTFQPRNLVLGPDGNMWFAFQGGNSNVIFGNITPSGSVTEYSVPSPSGYNLAPSLAFSKDGNAWIGVGNSLVEVTTQGGVLNMFSFNQSAYVNTVAQGPDGQLWFDGNGGSTSGALGTMRTNPNVLELFPILNSPPGCNSQNYGCSRVLNNFATGPDLNMWIADTVTGGYSSLASMSVNGVFNEYVIPAAHSTPIDVAPGPDGNVWFVDSGTQKIGRYKIK